jgi:UrcA family protein
MRVHLVPALALCAAAAVTAPAAAKSAYVVPAYSGAVDDGPYVDELVVTGPVGRNGPTRLSQAVDIRDLDLATHQDRQVLKWRIRDTARYLCRALGENPGAASPIAPSCVDQAIRDARPQVRLATNQAYARAYYASLDVADPYAPIP